MKKYKQGVDLWAFFLVVALVIATIVVICPISAAPDKSELLLRFKPGVDEKAKHELMNAYGLEPMGELSEIGIVLVSAPSVALPGLEHNPQIEFVEENRQYYPAMIPNDPSYASQWHLAKIGAPEAWDISIGDPAVVIAVLDTGVDTDHPDLATKLLLPGWNSWDCIWGCDVIDIEDNFGHGTAVAGTVAALTNNTIGVASIGWDNTILPIKVTAPQGYTTTFEVSAGLTYAASHGARVATVSFDLNNAGTALDSAGKYCIERGCIVFMAGGNANENVDNPDNPYYVHVSGTTSSDASYGTHGPFIDLSAPCTDIYTTTRGGGYGSVGGTSFSTPLAAGVAALMFSVNPSLTPQQVETILESTADDCGEPGHDMYYGWGRVNASKAVWTAKYAPPPAPDITPPTVVICDPPTDETVTGAILVTVEATDAGTVSKVELYKDGTLFATDPYEPYEFYWDTSNDSDGTHTLQAKAYDDSNNIGVSEPVSVIVANPPTVTILQPVNGEIVTDMTYIIVTVEDTSAISRLEYYINDKLLAFYNDKQLAKVAEGEPYIQRWNTQPLKTGYQNVTVQAYDAAGNRGAASIVVFTIN